VLSDTREGVAAGGVEVGGLDDPEPAQLLLGLGEGAVGGQDVAALGGVDDGGGVGGVQAAGGDPRTLLLELGVEGVDGLEGGLHGLG
jgi:hypothetical protein